MKNLRFNILSSFRCGNFKISKISFDVSNIFAMAFVKGSYSRLVTAMRLLRPMIHVVRGCMTPGSAKLCFLFILSISAIGRDQGLPGVVKYLKVGSVIIQQRLSGYKINDLSPIGPRIARSKSCLPKVIPSHQRQLMMAGDNVTMKF